MNTEAENSGPGQVYTHKNWQIMATVTRHSISEGDVNNVQYAATAAAAGVQANVHYTKGNA